MPQPRHRDALSHRARRDAVAELLVATFQLLFTTSSLMRFPSSTSVL